MTVTRKTKFGTRYFLWGTGLCLLFILAGVFLTPQGWRRVLDYYPNFLSMECLIIGLAFAPKRLREDAFLSELLFVLQQLLYHIFICIHLEEEGERLFNFLCIGFTATTAYFWHRLYLRNRQAHRILFSTGGCLLFFLFLDGWNVHFWTDFWIERSHLISYVCLLPVGGFFGYILCLCRNTSQHLVIGTLILAASVWCAINLFQALETYLVYGTPTGKTKEVFTQKLTDPEGTEKRLSDFPGQYQIFFIWNTDKNNTSAYDVYQFEQLAIEYWNLPQFSFLLLGISPNGYTPENNPLKLYKREHFHLPLLQVSYPADFWLQFNLSPSFEYVFISRNDTIIFKNNIKTTSHYLKKLKSHAY